MKHKYNAGDIVWCGDRGNNVVILQKVLFVEDDTDSTWYRVAGEVGIARVMYMENELEQARDPNDIMKEIL